MNRIEECRVCQCRISSFMSFGQMPVANGFYAPEDAAPDYTFELAPAFCVDCGTFQIVEQPEPEQMFHENYAFFSGTSRHMAEHFRMFAEDVRERYLSDDNSFVVEIGSNDGILIGNFAQEGIRHLGVEPSANVAQVARDKGIKTDVAFFTQAYAKQTASTEGNADLILAANVICHIPNVLEIAAAVATLLKPEGVFVFEEPYLGDMLAKGSYDQIYDEHVFIFSVRSVSAAFRKAGLEIIDVWHQPTHGGSMRYALAKKGARPVSESVSHQLRLEAEAGMDDPETYREFRRRCESSRDALVAQLRTCKEAGRRVAGYGATSKSTTVLNYCGIGADLIEFISDTTPTKQGKLAPGSAIPVLPPTAFHDDPPDFAVLFAWNHSEEIFAKEQQFSLDGGRWITFVPEVGVVQS